MKLDRDIVILDFELHQPHGTEEEKVILANRFERSPHLQLLEIGAVRLNRDGTLSEDKYEAMIKQSFSVSPYIQELTGITQDQVESEGRDVEEVLTEFNKWMYKNTTNVTLSGWGEDAFLYNAACTSLAAFHLATDKHRQEDIRIRMHTLASLLHCVPRKRAGLQAYMASFGITYDPKPRIHRAYSDAYNTGRLFEAAVLRHDLVKHNLAECLKSLGGK